MLLIRSHSYRYVYRNAHTHTRTHTRARESDTYKEPHMLESLVIHSDSVICNGYIHIAMCECVVGVFDLQGTIDDKLSQVLIDDLDSRVYM